MAKVERNIVIHGLSGSLADELIIQTGLGSSMIFHPKLHSPNGASDSKQTDMQEKLQTIDPVTLADWLHPPEVVTIDLETWNGRSGEKLCARVRDSAQIKQMYFIIAQEDGTLVEEGAGRRIKDSFWWEYVTTVDHPGGIAKVLVNIRGLPGID